MKRQTNVCQNGRSGSVPSSEPQPATAYNQICTVPKISRGLIQYIDVISQADHSCYRANLQDHRDVPRCN